jgi:hypothetical protein
MSGITGHVPDTAIGRSAREHEVLAEARSPGGAGLGRYLQ